MAELTYWLKRAIFHLAFFIVWIYMSVVSWGKKKSVPPVENELLKKTATQLAKEIREGKLKSVKVIQDYINRMKEIEPYINAIVQDNFDEAIKEAKSVDALIESGKFSEKQLLKEKPLLGVPFTVKCLIKVKGFPNTGASFIFKDRIADMDAPTVAQLKEAGGIFLALTNSPEFGSAFETVNKIYGRTYNPYDLTRTCGGSSGGEAALISAAGSIIGLGNDAFGSLRVPADYCGIFGHKPSIDLISIEGNFFETPPYMQTIFTLGPMCRFSEDLFLMMEVLQKNTEKINFRKEVDFRNLTIYYQTKLDHEYTFDTDKEIVQAIELAAFYFKEKYGTKVKEIKIPLLSKTIEITVHLLKNAVPSPIGMATDGLVKYFNVVVELFKMLFGKCRFTFSAVVSNYFIQSPMVYNKYLILQYERHMEELKNEFDELLDEDSLFFCPALPKIALHHNEAIFLLLSSQFLGAPSILGLPATQCPVGFSKKGLPRGIQIVAKKGNDVLTLLTAAEIEKSFGGWTPP